MAGGAWQGECVVGGCAWQGVCVAGEIATAAGGMHPTGMHSCCHKFYTNEGSKPKNSREQLRSTSSQYMSRLEHFGLNGFPSLR